MGYMKKWKKFLDGGVLAALEANASDGLLDGHVRWWARWHPAGDFSSVAGSA